MLRLENIKKSGNKVEFSAFVEDSNEQVNCVYNIENDTFEHSSLPKDYEWCNVYMYHAKTAIKKMLGKGNLQSRKTVMWY